jgi:hypothetical protein
LHKYKEGRIIIAKGGDIMEKKQGTAATKAKNKYNAANYDRLSPFVRKGKKDRYRAAAEAAGYSLNEFMEKAMDALAEEILGA